MTALTLLACPTGGEQSAKKVGDTGDANKVDPNKGDPNKVDPNKVDPEPKPEVPEPTGCTVGYTPELVNGASLWADVPNPAELDNCNFHRLAYNNFLYLVGGTTPRFLTEMASTYGDLAEAGTWPTTPQGLEPRGELQQHQAGDNFELLDVGGKLVVYDIRINRTMWDAMAANGWNAPLTAAQASFNANPATGGVWLPPNIGAPVENPSADSSMELKSSWRNYGPNEADCPAAIMFCTKGADGNWLGLLGMHLVQKTATHGEWIWASFEHVANAPDCNPTLSTGQPSSNPLQQNPRDPTNPSATINVNGGTLAGQSGWSVFDFSTYQAAGGNGTSCDYPKGDMIDTPGPCANPSGSPQCNGNPQNPDGKGGYLQINICRTEPIPDHSTPAATQAVCASAKNPVESVMTSNNVACITQSVLDNWPAGLDNRWKYYALVGVEWAIPFDGGAGTGAPTVGCFNVSNTADPRDNYTCPTTGGPFVTYTTSGSVSLANTTMESWMQGANSCITYDPGNGAQQSLGTVDCMSCHQPDTLANSADLSHAFSAFVGTPPA